MLRVRNHGDPSRIASEVLALQAEYDVGSRHLVLWEAHIAARNYPAALEVIDSFHELGLPSDDWSYVNLPDRQLARLITLGLQGASSVSAADERLALQGAQSAAAGDPLKLPLAKALLAAAVGRAAEAQGEVRRWRRGAQEDYALLAVLRHYGCRALGMANAVAATVDCFESALAEPSLLIPFVEPLLPYYDGMREDPRFVKLAASLGVGAKAAPVAE